MYTIYVAAFCPRTDGEHESSTGGFVWRKSCREAAEELQGWIDEDLAKHDSLTSDYVLRALRVPDEVDATGSAGAVSDWLDDNRELWETHEQDGAARPRSTP
jgi:hypothetical protein